MNKMPYNKETSGQKQIKKPYKKNKTGNQNNKYSNVSKKQLQDLHDSLSSLKSKISSLSEKQKDLKASYDNSEQIQIKMYESVTTFFDNLSTVMANGDLQPLTGTGIGAKLSEKRFTKEEIVAMIKKLRLEGATLAQIADFLKDQNLPTFSGKGNWHAQSIHNLCKEKNIDLP